VNTEEQDKTDNRVGEQTMKPLRVGMLRLNQNNIWHPQHTACAMMYTARQFDIELFLFHPDDVDLETSTINALFLNNKGEKIRRRVPFPLI
jgi:hypothetical protein